MDQHDIHRELDSVIAILIIVEVYQLRILAVFCKTGRICADNIIPLFSYVKFRSNIKVYYGLLASRLVSPFNHKYPLNM